MNRVQDQPATVTGVGSFSPPPGVTAEEADQLAEQADNERGR